MYDSYYFFSFVLIFSGGGVDYLSTIKRDGSNKNGENTFSPQKYSSSLRQIHFETCPKRHEEGRRPCIHYCSHNF